jgi:hypothetical protein
MDAFNDLRPKLNDRIKDRKDVSLVMRCLSPLSTYLYTQIPDLSDTEVERQILEEVARISLLDFGAEKKGLASYASEIRPTPVPVEMRNKRGLLEMLSWLFGNELTIIRFISWWVVLFILITLATVLSLLEIKGLKLDTTMIALAIGSPLAIAAVLTAIPGSSKRRDG